MKPHHRIFRWLTLLVVINVHYSAAFAQGTAFSYQGQFTVNGAAANGIYDLGFTIYNSTNNPGTIVAGPITNAATAVVDGAFQVMLDFGSAIFTGAPLWLQVEARTNGATAFTTLSPRQPIGRVPFAVFAESASNLLGTLPASQLPAGVVTNNQTSSLQLNGGLTVTGSEAVTQTLYVGGYTYFGDVAWVLPGQGIYFGSAGDFAGSPSISEENGESSLFFQSPSRGWNSVNTENTSPYGYSAYGTYDQNGNGHLTFGIGNTNSGSIAQGAGYIETCDTDTPLVNGYNQVAWPFGIVQTTTYTNANVPYAQHWRTVWDWDGYLHIDDFRTTSLTPPSATSTNRLWTFDRGDNTLGPSVLTAGGSNNWTAFIKGGTNANYLAIGQSTTNAGRLYVTGSVNVTGTLTATNASLPDSIGGPTQNGNFLVADANNPYAEYQATQSVVFAYATNGLAGVAIDRNMYILGMATNALLVFPTNFTFFGCTATNTLPSNVWTEISFHFRGPTSSATNQANCFVKLQSSQ